MFLEPKPSWMYLVAPLPCTSFSSSGAIRPFYTNITDTFLPACCWQHSQF